MGLINVADAIAKGVTAGAIRTKTYIDSQVAVKANEITLNTADISTLKSQFGSMASMLVFKGSDTNTNILAKTGMVANDCWWDTTNNQYIAYNGTSWISGVGDMAIGDNSVTPSKTSFLEVINIFNIADITMGQVNHALYGWVTDANYQDSGYIPVIYNSRYICNFVYVNNLYVNYWTKTKTGISNIAGSTALSNHILTIPNNSNIAYVSFALITQENISTLMFVKGTILPTDYIPHKYTFTSIMDKCIQTKDISEKAITVEKLADDIILNSRIKNIIFNVLGDSLSSVDYTLPNWWQIIANRTGAFFNNYAISGTPIKSNGSNGFVDRYSSMSDSADGIIVMGSTNDSATQLGLWDSTDATTFLGALNILMQGLINKYPGKPIIFITPTPLWFNPNLYSKNPLVDLLSKSAADTVTLQLRVEAIIAKCKQYGLHLIDVYNNSGINYYDTNKIYYISDQTHESALGHERLANFIGVDLESMF